MFFKALHEGSNCYLVLNKQTLELLYLAMEGGLRKLTFMSHFVRILNLCLVIEFITQEKAFNVEMQSMLIFCHLDECPRY